jgi:hypothetical protein
MSLITETIEGGFVTVSDSTRKFFADYSAALFAGDFTPMENRPGAAEAIEEFKSLFADGFSCQAFKDLLYNLGMFGCGRSRRLKAMAALLGLTDDEVEDCLKQPREEPGPKVYYLPPEYSPIRKIGKKKPPVDPDDENFCYAPNPEDTEDLEDRPDCQAAMAMLQDLHDLFPPHPLGLKSEEEGLQGVSTVAAQQTIEQPTFEADSEPDGKPKDIEIPPIKGPLYSPKTYLDAIYLAINISQDTTLEGCSGVEASAEALIERIQATLLELPIGYINPQLLPPGFEVPVPEIPERPPIITAGLSTGAGMKARRAAASARRRRTIQLEA